MIRLRMPFYLAAVLCASLLAGCGEPEKVTLHEPGVYKGAKDPLIAKTSTREHEDLMRERVLMVQTDR